MKPKQCDCCGQMRYSVIRTWTIVGETFACAICRSPEWEREDGWNDEAEAKAFALGY